MATQFTSLYPGWLPLVGWRPFLLNNAQLRADVSALHQKYRPYEPHEDDRDHDREARAVDSRGQGIAEELERGEVLHPGRPFENRTELVDQVAGEGQAPQQADRRARVPRGQQRPRGREDHRKW